MAKRRGNKEGSIYQRSTGRWQAMISLKGRRLGKSFETRRQAAEWITAMAVLENRGLTFEGTKTNLEGYLSQWLQDIKSSVRSSTYLQYQGVVKRYINPSLGSYKLSQITPRTIQSLYTERIENGTGKRTVEVIHAVLHRALKMAVRQGLIGSNPSKDVQKPKHKPARMKVLSEGEIQHLLEVSNMEGLGELIWVAVTTGLRKGEILALTWADVDWASATVRVDKQLLRLGNKLELVSPKTDMGIRTVKVGKATLSKLGRLLIEQQQIQREKPSWNKQGFLFPSSTGTAKDPRNLVREFKKLLVLGTLPDIRFHDLRHTAASLMLLTNMPIISISRQLGHAKPSTTLDIYGHLIPGLETNAMERIEELVGVTAT